MFLVSLCIYRNHVSAFRSGSTCEVNIWGGVEHLTGFLSVQCDGLFNVQSCVIDLIVIAFHSLSVVQACVAIETSAQVISHILASVLLTVDMTHLFFGLSGVCNPLVYRLNWHFDLFSKARSCKGHKADMLFAKEQTIAIISKHEEALDLTPPFFLDRMNWNWESVNTWLPELDTKVQYRI